MTTGFSTVTSAGDCWEGWVKLTHPSQQPQLLLMAPWSGHSVHKWSQPFLSFERLTSTFFEMRNSVSIKIGKKQSINQSINQSIWIKPSISRILKFAVYCRGLLDPKVSNQSCGGMQAAQCNVLKHATESHAMTLTYFTWNWFWVQDFVGPCHICSLGDASSWLPEGQKAEPATGWRPQWSIERLQSRSNTASKRILNETVCIHFFVCFDLDVLLK